MKRKILIFMALLFGTFSATAENTVSVSSALIPQGKTGSFTIDLTNPGDVFVAFELAISLPEGVTFVSATKGNRYADNHGLGVATHGTTTKITLNSNTNEAITGESGALLIVNVAADADIEVGTVVKGTLQDMEFARKNETVFRPDAFDFDIEITDKVVLDENSVIVPEATDDEVAILVKRTIKGDRWNTICLPFDMTEEQVYEAFGDDVQLAEFDTDDGYGVDDDGNIEVYFIDTDIADGYYANWPYIIKTSSDISEFTVTAQLIPDEDDAVAEYTTGRGSKKKTVGTFTGTLHAGTVIPENNLFLNAEKFYYSTGKTTSKAFRAYFWFEDILDEVGSAGSRISLSVKDGSVTGIDEMERWRDGGNEKWLYDLQGRRVRTGYADTTAKGVYIKNGRKKLVK